MVTEKIDEFVAHSRQIGAEGLQLCSSGNISWRISDNIALMSGTGAWIARLRREDVAQCDISSGALMGGAVPSMESAFHLGIMRKRRDVNVVFHFQSEYATIVSCMKNRPDNFNVTAEVACYCGSEIAIVPYLTPGSKELASQVIEAMTDHDTALLCNHGQIVCGKDFDDAIRRAHFFEMACRIIVLSGERGYNTLCEKDIDVLRQSLITERSDK